MKFVHFHRRTISLYVILAFTALLCIWANQAPAAPAKPETEKSPAYAAAGGEEKAPGFMEEETAPAVKKKKFPWLIVGAAVVIGAVAVYFLVLKKTKYELTVTLGEGCTGTPGATAKYKKGEAVSYSYSAQSGWGNLQVKLDGAAVPASGTVTMDKAHSLTVSASQGATLQVNSTPAGAKIYLDKADSGQVTPYTFNYSAATTKTVLLRHQCGYQEWTRTASANLGQVTEVAAVLARGISEEFEIPLSPCWLPRDAAAWSVGAGRLNVVHLNKRGYEHILYNYSFPPDFTLTVKVKHEKGKPYHDVSLILTSSTDMTFSKGYEILFNADRDYAIFKNNSYNFTYDKGAYGDISGWRKSSALNTGLGVWNTIKIVKQGANYSYYANGAFLYSFVNDEWDPRYIALATADEDLTVQIDSVLLTTGGSRESVPGLPVPGALSTGPKRSNGRR